MLVLYAVKILELLFWVGRKQYFCFKCFIYFLFFFRLMDLQHLIVVVVFNLEEIFRLVVVEEVVEEGEVVDSHGTLF
jgi:hypothetical protein